MAYLYDPTTYINNRFAAENTFRTAAPDGRPVPAFADSRGLLPDPHWDGRDRAIECYWKSWELAFGNLKRPTPENGFVSPYIDMAFNEHLFMWDTSFIMQFGRYGGRAFPFHGGLDNLYSKQHPDGYICREIDEANGQDCFQRHDPASTGPNVMAWAEWEHYLQFGDAERLKRVFPVLAAYHEWLRAHRSWPDGTYWTSGWGSGVDNQPRQDISDISFSEPKNVQRYRWFSHGHMSWLDATIQQALNGRILEKMAREAGRPLDGAQFGSESDSLARFINRKMWDGKAGFYFDRHRDGRLSNIKSIIAYWALIAGIVPKKRLAAFTAHLNQGGEFNRPHRVPALSADAPGYDPAGGYWNGGVWPPTEYMVLRGLTGAGMDALAHEIAMNHLENVYRVFESTGTVWENYAPESAAPGKPAKPDFVGWSGLGPISVMLEYAFGIRPDASRGTVVWDVRLLDGHGVANYPFGPLGTMELRCAPRARPEDEPRIEAASTVPVKLEIRWAGGKRRLNVRTG